jgi:tRNA U54 and U55 pseudouridine synthase Pus10
MWIFYNHLPFGTTIRKINNVTLKGFRSKFGLASLFKRNIIKRSKIIRIKDLKADSVEYHAIVQVDSPVTAENIIENLDGKMVNGLYLRPHRYHRRYPSRDRRHHQAAPPNLRERRQGDRRRSNLITRVMEIS